MFRDYDSDDESDEDESSSASDESSREETAFCDSSSDCFNFEEPNNSELDFVIHMCVRC